jgi:putative ABC transport system ATP-binding protein
MTEPKGAIETAATVSISSAGSILLCRDVHKSFGPTVALRGIDLEIRKGEILAVTGESGSGKSTLMLCLSGILGVDKGTILYRDRNLTTMPDRDRTELRLAQFGFVFQTGHLVPDMPALLNVAFPLMLRGYRRDAAEAHAQAWLERFGVEGVGDRLPGEMSVGQGQRVAVARALAIGPTVIFADEPTGSLDSRNSAVVIDMLVKSAREQGAAVVLVTHSQDVALVADRRITMRDGTLARH